MERITMAHLENAVLRLNQALGRPESPYSKASDGTYKANLGNFHLSGAYGGYQLQEMASDGGGVRSHTPGYAPKREVYNAIRAMLAGVSLAKS